MRQENEVIDTFISVTSEQREGVRRNVLIPYWQPRKAIGSPWYRGSNIKLTNVYTSHDIKVEEILKVVYAVVVDDYLSLV